MLTQKSIYVFIDEKETGNLMKPFIHIYKLGTPE